MTDTILLSSSSISQHSPDWSISRPVILCEILPSTCNAVPTATNYSPLIDALILDRCQTDVGSTEPPLVRHRRESAARSPRRTKERRRNEGNPRRDTSIVELQSACDFVASPPPLPAWTPEGSSFRRPPPWTPNAPKSPGSTQSQAAVTQA